jgi:ATPase complex subunit ATP10
LQSFQSRDVPRHFTSASVLRLPEAPKPTNTPEKKSDEEFEFVPQPLGRPIGFSSPPKAGDNLGTKTKKVYTGATMSERNLEKRKDVVEAWSQNYFRDFINIRKYRGGKTFMANPRIFRADMSLYFPNLHGETLAEASADTTPVLKGKVSVVNIYSSQWGEAQAQTFTGEKENPALAEVLKQHSDVAQRIDINIEENPMKAWVIELFKWRLRKPRAMEDWGKYFIVRKGVSQRIRETIGLLNGRVGYIYLVDENCKIRWAASGNAEGTEKDDLTRGLERLVREIRQSKLRSQEKRLELKAQRDAESPSGKEIASSP